jgi:hypothetical protein
LVGEANGLTPPYQGLPLNTILSQTPSALTLTSRVTKNHLSVILLHGSVFPTKIDLPVFVTSVAVHRFNHTLNGDNVFPTTDFRTVCILLLTASKELDGL